MSDRTPTVAVFYDYVCPYAYVGLHRARRLARDHDLAFEWLPWEIHPDTAARGEELDREKDGSSWVDTLADELGLELEGPGRAMNSNLALRAAEVAKDQGADAFERYHDAIFEAVWARGEDLSTGEAVARVAGQAGLDGEQLLEDALHQAYQTRLDLVDEHAVTLGIQRVPTFVFGDQRIVGNDRFEPSLARPVEAFLERRKHIGDEATTLEADTGLAVLY